VVLRRQRLAVLVRDEVAVHVAPSADADLPRLIARRIGVGHDGLE